VEDVETDLPRSWNAYEHRGTSTWEQMKEAVRDAWDPGYWQAHCLEVGALALPK